MLTNRAKKANLTRFQKPHEYTNPPSDVSTAEILSTRRGYVNLGVFQFLTFIRRGVFYSFMINYLFMLMQTVTSTAALGTLNMITSALGQNLLWGRISDHHKIRAGLIVIGETIAALAYIVVFFIHKSLIDIGSSFSAGLTIIFGLSTLEFFWSMSDVGWAALLTDVTTFEKRGRVIGILNFIASLGIMVGTLFAGFLYNGGEGFRTGTIFYIVMVLLLSNAALMTFTLRRIKAAGVSQEKTLLNERRNDKNSMFEGESARTYKWFLFSLIVIVLGAASVNQIFLLFLKLTEGLNTSDPEMSLILASWTIGGMIASLVSGRLSDKIGRVKVLTLGLSLAIITPLLYGSASTVTLMALTRGLNGVAFWTIQTVGFAFAGDLISEHRRGRLLGRYNTVMALSWGPAGLLIGGPLADLQVKNFELQPYVAYINVFYISSVILIIGTILFAYKVTGFRRGSTG